jgi:NAD(P)-dependent dehydrogenase (short-subunit alcohol dehydrogenase family)
MPASLSRVALITGAARGIGFATAKCFRNAGWRVALLDIVAIPTIETARWLGDSDSDSVLTLQADVSDPQAVAKAIAAVRDKFGRLDALINNAGTAVFKPALETTLEEWQRVIAVNLTGPFIMTQATIPMLSEQGGAIVNITSISGLRASTLRVAYGTSKAGLAHLTKQLAVELASAGIRVNGVAPGPIDTAMAKAVHSPEIRADYHNSIPLNRYGLEDEIAQAVFFLCGDQASYITGQVLAVDGGFDAAGIGLSTLRRDGRTC